jgi:hypothetical protein
MAQYKTTSDTKVTQTTLNKIFASFDKHTPFVLVCVEFNIDFVTMISIYQEYLYNMAENEEIN